MQAAFRQARAVWPTKKLIYDDYGTAEFYDPYNQVVDNKTEAAFEMARNTPDLDVGGTQVDIMLPENAAGVNQVYNRLMFVFDRLASIGKEASITGMSVMIPSNRANEANVADLQAQTFVAIVRACVESPNCFRMVHFGIFDASFWGNHTFPNIVSALLFGNNWNQQLQSLQPKPAYTMVRDYLRQQTFKRMCSRR